MTWRETAQQALSRVGVGLNEWVFNCTCLGCMRGADAEHSDAPLSMTEFNTTACKFCIWRGMTDSFSVGADDMAGDSSAGTIQVSVHGEGGGRVGLVTGKMCTLCCIC